jgi:hypothetical protein
MVAQAGTLFVVELSDVSPPDCTDTYPRTCTMAAQVRVTRILKDRDHDLELGRLQASLVQTAAPSKVNPWTLWTYREVGSGQRYLVLAHRHAGKPVENPMDLELLDGTSDPVADAELLLGIASLPFSQQVRAVAAAVSNSPSSHSRILVDYIMALLRSASEGDTAPLTTAISTAPIEAFRGKVREELLASLGDQAMSSEGASVDAFRLAVTMATKYFLIDPDGPGRPECTLDQMRQGCGYVPRLPGTYSMEDQPFEEMPGMTKARRYVLDYFMPWLLKDDGGKALLRSVLDRGTAGRLAAKAAELARNERLAGDQRQRAAELAGFAGTPSNR